MADEGATPVGPVMTLDEIEQLTEIWEGFALMEQHGVPKEDCQSLEDMKERLRLHCHKQIGDGRSTEAAQEVISCLKSEDEAKRKQLREILLTTAARLQGLEDQVKEHLVREGSTENFDKDMERHIKSLKSSECPILVAGETSSGKSSLLNLFLGKEILPQSLLSCTSVICKIKYGPALMAKIHHKDGNVEERFLDVNSSLVDQLSKYIYKSGNRQETDGFTAVDITLRLPILKTGVYIIDSPGFGENAAMDRLLLDYISSNEIFAFIYVIKTDNAGGIQEDRLQKFLRYVVDLQQSHRMGNFDPRSAIFVCNRWDLIPEKERDVVKQDTFKKLSRCWPDLHQSQIFYLSTTKAWSTRMAGYVSEDYALLLDGIQRLIPISLQRKVTYSYKWLEHILTRVLHHVTSYLSKTRLSSKELQARHKETRLRLHKVEKEADVIMKRLDKQLDKNIRKIAKKLSDFLKTKEAQEKMRFWVMDELPLPEEEDIWVDVEAEIDCKIEKRLAEILREWDEKNKMFQGIQSELLTAFKEEFQILENQLSVIEHLIQSDDLSLSDKTDEETTKYLGLADNISAPKDFFDINLTTLQKLALGFAAPVLVPVAIGFLVGAPIFLLWDFKKWRRRSIAQKNLQTYIEDPTTFVAQRSLAVLEKVAEVNNVEDYVFNQMEPARAHLEVMRSTVPKLVESNRHLVDAIMQDKRTREELEATYSAFESLIPELQEQLATFGNLYIRNYDFSTDDIEYCVEKSTIFKRCNQAVGIWTEMKKAKLSQNGKHQDVTVKRYRRPVSALHMLMEETHLRKSKHPHLCELFGTFEESRGVASLLFERHLVTARQELFGFRALPKTSKGRNALMERCRQILEQIGMGLEYLHYRGLVHMELSLDTVMMIVNKDHVKLTNIGEPRVADLPQCMEYEAGDFVCLPPEVLHGAIYRPRCDIYSLGVIAWELWNQDRAFKQERKSRLDQFIQTVKSTTLTQEEQNPFGPLIGACLTHAPEERICSTSWVNEIRKIHLSRKKGTQEDEK